MFLFQNSVIRRKKKSLLSSASQKVGLGQVDKSINVSIEVPTEIERKKNTDNVDKGCHYENEIMKTE